MKTNISVQVEFWSARGAGAGWRVVWYNEDADTVSYWYASTRGEAEQRAKFAPPARKFWFANSSSESCMDAATLTGMYDYD